MPQEFDRDLAQKLNEMGLEPEEIEEVFDDMPAAGQQDAGGQNEEADRLERLKTAQREALAEGDLRGAMRAAVGQLQSLQQRSGGGGE